MPTEPRDGVLLDGDGKVVTRVYGWIGTAVPPQTFHECDPRDLGIVIGEPLPE